MRIVWWSDRTEGAERQPSDLWYTSCTIFFLARDSLVNVDLNVEWPLIAERQKAERGRREATNVDVAQSRLKQRLGL